jgi:hypothetical protein
MLWMGWPPMDEERERTCQLNNTQQSNRSQERGRKMVVATVMTAMTTMTTTTTLRSKRCHRQRGQQVLTFVPGSNDNAAGDNNLHIDRG